MGLFVGLLGGYNMVSDNAVVSAFSSTGRGEKAIASTPAKDSQGLPGEP